MAEGIARLLQSPGHVHLVGIGGVGMAGLARLLMQAGFKVSGSDQHPNRLTGQLAEAGVIIYQGHAQSQVEPLPDWAIRTPALGEENVEVNFLRAHQVPVFVRGQVLAAYTHSRRCVAVAGAHGKTTTTAMLASLLRYVGHASGYAVGGETSLPGAVADCGNNQTFVFEADESDGTLVHYAPDVGMLTHVEWDHIERFRSETALLQCYRRFVKNCGSIWIKEGDTLAEEVCVGASALYRMGESELADLQLTSTQTDADGQQVSFKKDGFDYQFHIPLPGKHNAWNGLMAIAAASELGVPVKEACVGLSQFEGVARRFQKVEKNEITLIQDYAHHPTEIRAVMASVAALNPPRLWVVFQPHRFSRTQHLLDGFAKAFKGAGRLALLPVYAASERSEQGVGSQQLADRCREIYEKVELFDDRDALIKVWASLLRSEDVVLMIGAGDIEKLQTELWEAL